MLQKGYLVLTGGVRSEVLTLTPPLTIHEDRLSDAAGALRDVLLHG
jgi:4-aminobutyrate aminotransferase-like enzyme